MAGRPKGAWADKAFRDALRIAVMRPAAEEDPKPKTKLDEVAIALVGAGKAGDVTAIREIADRLDGKATQIIEATVKDERMVVEAPAPAKDADAWSGQYGRPN